jgi:hypothetical protein
MSKVDGVPLSSLWNTMEDQLRDVVLRQVVDIILELSSQRFDMIGVLLKRDGIGKNAWYIEPMAGESMDDLIAHRAVSTTTHTNGIEYWTDFMNCNLQDISHNNFGITGKEFPYSRAWFMRSLVPSLYDMLLDAIDFPLLHGDFHSQNIMVTDVESNPRITAGNFPLRSLHPLSRSIPSSLSIIRCGMITTPCIQGTFETRLHLTKSCTKRSSKETQMVVNHFHMHLRIASPFIYSSKHSNPILHAKLFDQLFELIYGDDEDDFSVYYYRALMRKGILKKETQRFEDEAAVWREASDTLAELNISRDLSKSAFKALMLKYHNRFAVGGKVRVVGC